MFATIGQLLIATIFIIVISLLVQSLFVDGPEENASTGEEAGEWQFESADPSDSSDASEDPASPPEDKAVSFEDAEPDANYSFQTGADNYTYETETSDLTDVPTVGDELAERIEEALGITAASELKEAAESGELKEVDGFGEKRVSSIRDHFE